MPEEVIGLALEDICILSLERPYRTSGTILKCQLKRPEMTALKALILLAYARGMEAAHVECVERIGGEIRPPQLAGASLTTDRRV